MPKRDAEKKLSPKRRRELFEAWKAEAAAKYEAQLDGWKQKILADCGQRLEFWTQDTAAQIGSFLESRKGIILADIETDLDVLKNALIAPIGAAAARLYESDEIEIWPDGTVQIRIPKGEDTGDAQNG